MEQRKKGLSSNKIKRKYPVLGNYIETIDEWLEKDKNEPRKQRHTSIRIYDRLKSELKFNGSYGCVKDYIYKKKKETLEKHEGFLPLAHPKSHGQADFGEFQYIDHKDIRQKGYYLILSFPYSNAGFMQVFKSQNQECLLEGLKLIFKHINGVPKVIRFDNMTTAVAKVLVHGERDLSEGFRRFKLHYRFECEFCNPAKGNEKGNVENKVGYLRRNLLVPVPKIENLEEFNKNLFLKCEEKFEKEHYIKGLTVRELWNEETTKLNTLPENKYEVFRYETGKNQQLWVHYDGHQYIWCKS